MSATPRPRRAGRAQVLRTAQIYDVGPVEALPTGDITAAVLVGAEVGEMHRHGLRAPRARWAKLIRRLLIEDPTLRAELLAA